MEVVFGDTDKIDLVTYLELVVPWHKRVLGILASRVFFFAWSFE